MLRVALVVARKSKKLKRLPINQVKGTEQEKPIKAPQPVQGPQVEPPQEKKPCDLVLGDSITFDISKGLARMYPVRALGMLATTAEKRGSNPNVKDADVKDAIKSLEALEAEVEFGVQVTKACGSEKVKQRIIQRVYLLNPSAPRKENETDEETKTAQSEHLCSVLNGLAAGLDRVATLEVWFKLKETKDWTNRESWKFTDQKMAELGLTSVVQEVERKQDHFDLRSSHAYQHNLRTKKKTSGIVFVMHRWLVWKANLPGGADGGGGGTDDGGGGGGTDGGVSGCGK